MRVTLSILAVLLAAAAPSAAPAASPVELDSLAGDGTVTDPAGLVGHSRIVVQAPGAMLFELRDIRPDGPQPLWFEFSERNHGWVQLFGGPAGIREFPVISAPDVWPQIFGADVTMRDGSAVRYRLTMSRTSIDETRRILEISKDKGATWNMIFDYQYHRDPKAPN